MEHIREKDNQTLRKDYSRRIETTSQSEWDVVWGFIGLIAGQYGSMCCSILFTFILARWLAPADFGRFAVGVFSFDLFNALTEWGWEQGLFRSTAQENVVFSSHLWTRLVLGSIPVIIVSLMVASGYVADPLIALSSVLLAVAVWAEKIGITYKSILERSYVLKRLAMFELGAMIASYMCALGALWSGYGALSLIVQRVSERIFLLVGYVYASPWKIGWDYDITLVRNWIAQFGFATWASGLLSMFLYDFMGAFVGVHSGVHYGGLYARSFKMATFPLMVTGVMQRMAIPLYAQKNDEPRKVKEVFLRFQIIKALILIPMQLFLICTAHAWIPLLLGNQWVEAVGLYRLLGVYGLVRAFYDDVPTMFLYGLGEPWILVQQHLVQGSGMGLSAAICSWWLSDAWLGAGIMVGAMIIAASVVWIRTMYALQIHLQDIVATIKVLYDWAHSFVVNAPNVRVQGATVVHEKQKDRSNRRTLNQ